MRRGPLTSPFKTLNFFLGSGTKKYEMVLFLRGKIIISAMRSVIQSPIFVFFSLKIYIPMCYRYQQDITMILNNEIKVKITTNNAKSWVLAPFAFSFHPGKQIGAAAPTTSDLSYAR